LRGRGQGMAAVFIGLLLPIELRCHPCVA